MGLLERGMWALLWVLAGVASLRLSSLSSYNPGILDSCLFGPDGAAFFGQGILMFRGGYLSLGLGGLWPYDPLDALPPVPSAAPLHVFGLLGAGFLDLSTDYGFAASPALSLGALLLGGLWSRRLGPHKEVWSWDVVEVTAVDLLMSELAAEHFWQKRPVPVGVAWGGGEVRLFRSGLAASHHHLSATGFKAWAAHTWHQSLVTMVPCLSFGIVYWPAQCPVVGAVRSGPLKAEGLKYGAPAAFGEASLAAWAAAILAPSSGAIAAWGLWGGAFYLWLLVSPAFIYLGLLAASPRKPLWTHYPLAPLVHIFAAPIPWAPYILANRFALRAKLWVTN